MGELRLIRKMNLPNVEPAKDIGELPRFEWVIPTTIFVDEKYQRSLSRRSIELIKKIVAEFNWNRLKPPICVEHENGYECIDGQHTALAAASHPDITRIPVMIVQANEIAGRADAFVRHNRDRIPVNAGQIFYSRIAAGEPEAKQIMDICKAYGVNILKSPDPNPSIGDCAAISSIETIYKKAGPAALRRVIAIVGYGQLKPIQALSIRAVRNLIVSEEMLRTTATDEDFKTVVRAVGDRIGPISKSMSAQSGKQQWKCAMAYYGSEVKKLING